MKKTIGKQITEVIEGTHVLSNGSPSDNLRDYHRANAVKAALRCDWPKRISEVKRVLHAYRVTVSLAYDPSKICIRNNSKGNYVLESLGVEKGMK